MMKLEILIPQYEEDEYVIKHMLDSLESQINVDFKNDFAVIIGNDGSDVLLSKRFLGKYSFPITYHRFEHSRLAGCRKKLFECSTADYIMFCDADDMFISNIAISEIINSMVKGFDMLVCDFYEEITLNNRVYYAPYKKDTTFVHGKVYRRQFLIDQNIQWHPELYEHQDGCFTSLARFLSKKTLNYTHPLYLWRDNPNSVTRRNRNEHIVKTLHRFIDAQEFLVQDLIDHGVYKKAATVALHVLYYCYYLMAYDYWHTEENKQYKEAIYERIARYHRREKILMEQINDEKDIEAIKKKAKENVEDKYKGALNTPLPSFEDWMKCIIALF